MALGLRFLIGEEEDSDRESSCSVFLFFFFFCLMGLVGFVSWFWAQLGRIITFYPPKKKFRPRNLHTCSLEELEIFLLHFFL